MYPADVCRALVMSSPGTGAKEAVGGFIKNHGLAGFAKQGMVAEITRGTLSRAVKFFFHPIAHEAIFSKKVKDGNPFSKGIAGVFATIPEVLAISPIENIKLAEQLDKDKKFNGMGSVITHINKTRGFSGFYIGFSGMQMRQGLWTGGFFGICDWASACAAGVMGKGVGADIVGGFLAGMFGVGLNCWCDVTRTVIQKEAIQATFTHPEPSAGGGWGANMNLPAFIAKAGEIAGKQGVMNGLYAGVHVKAVHLGGSGALLAVLMPRFKSMFGCE